MKRNEQDVRERIWTALLGLCAVGLAAVAFWPDSAPWWSSAEGRALHRTVAAAVAADPGAWSSLAEPGAAGAWPEVTSAVQGRVRAWYQPAEPGRFLALVSDLPEHDTVLLHYVNRGKGWMVARVEAPAPGQQPWWMQEPYGARWQRIGL